MEGNGNIYNPKEEKDRGVDDKDVFLKPAEYDKETEDTDDGKPPVDRMKIVYFVLLLHGVGSLMPWNMFINATNYFTEYKLGAPQSSIVDNITGNVTDLVAEKSVYSSYFLNFLGFTAQIPNVLFNGANLFCQCGAGGNIGRRIVYSLLIANLMFIFTIGMAMMDSSDWPSVFFWLTMISVVILNMANGVYQNSVYGVAACLPMKYTNAVVLGSNISGTITAILSLVSLASAPDPRSAAIYYFLAAIFILLLAVDSYVALPMNNFFRYFHDRAEKKSKLEQEEHSSSRPPFFEIFKQCWVQDCGVFLVFFVTLSCFPAVTAGIVPSDPNFPIPPKYFTGVTCFLFFNAFAMFGSLTSEFFTRPGPKYVWIPIVLRLLFIPFFMLCNFKPESRMLPVIINNDWVYCIAMIIFAWSSGYFSSLTMMYAPRCVEPAHQATAGMMAAFFLIMGIFMGIIFSFPVVFFIETVG